MQISQRLRGGNAGAAVVYAIEVGRDVQLHNAAVRRSGGVRLQEGDNTEVSIEDKDFLRSRLSGFTCHLAFPFRPSLK